MDSCQGLFALERPLGTEAIATTMKVRFRLINIFLFHLRDRWSLIPMLGAKAISWMMIPMELG